VVDIQILEFPGHDLPTFRYRTCEAIQTRRHVCFQTTHTVWVG